MKREYETEGGKREKRHNESLKDNVEERNKEGQTQVNTFQGWPTLHDFSKLEKTIGLPVGSWEDKALYFKTSSTDQLRYLFSFPVNCA